MSLDFVDLHLYACKSQTESIAQHLDRHTHDSKNSFATCVNHHPCVCRSHRYLMDWVLVKVMNARRE